MLIADSFCKLCCLSELVQNIPHLFLIFRRLQAVSFDLFGAIRRNQLVQHFPAMDLERLFDQFPVFRVSIRREFQIGRSVPPLLHPGFTQVAQVLLEVICRFRTYVCFLDRTVKCNLGHLLKSFGNPAVATGSILQVWKDQKVNLGV